MFGYLLEKNPPEIYRMDVVENAITLTIKSNLYKYILEYIKRKELINDLLAIKRIEEGDHVIFLIDLPYISLPNLSHKKLDWDALGLCVEKMSILLYIVNFYFYEPLSEEFCLSKQPQLMIISSGYSKKREMHGCPLELGFCEHIAICLAKKYTKEIDCISSIERAADSYLRLSSVSKSEFEKERKNFVSVSGGMFGITVKVRDCGVPQFSVPGNCACLGENPETFRYSRDMFSHNLDSTLQQVTMIVAIITFWNDVLRPLYEENSSFAR